MRLTSAVKTVFMIGHEADQHTKDSIQCSLYDMADDVVIWCAQ